MFGLIILFLSIINCGGNSPSLTVPKTCSPQHLPDTEEWKQLPILNLEQIKIKNKRCFELGEKYQSEDGCVFSIDNKTKYDHAEWIKFCERQRPNN